MVRGALKNFVACTRLLTLSSVDSKSLNYQVCGWLFEGVSGVCIMECHG